MFKKLRYSFSEPPPRIGVFFASREIAELTTDRSGFSFRYLPAFRELNLSPLPGFPDVEKTYTATRLWPFFLERIPDRRRPEIRELIEREGLQEASELQLLARLGSRTITDPFEFRLIAA